MLPSYKLPSYKFPSYKFPPDIPQHLVLGVYSHRRLNYTAGSLGVLSFWAAESKEADPGGRSEQLHRSQSRDVRLSRLLWLRSRNSFEGEPKVDRLGLRSHRPAC